MARKKGRGWHGEPGRHAKAARGIKTAKTRAERKELREGTLEYLRSLEEEPLVVIEAKPQSDDPFGMEREQVIPRPVAKPPAKFVLDFSKMESAFTENTTYYGGHVTVNGVEVDVPESDREAPGIDAIIGKEIEKQLGRVLTENEYDELEEVTDEARHSPSETHLAAVVEWKPKWRTKTETTFVVKKAKAWSAAQHYVLSLGGDKGKYAHLYLNYYVAEGPEPRQPRRLSLSDMVTIQMRIKAFF